MVGGARGECVCVCANASSSCQSGGRSWLQPLILFSLPQGSYTDLYRILGLPLPHSSVS